jgi:AcrR family transcriptional regulator
MSDAWPYHRPARPGGSGRELGRDVILHAAATLATADGLDGLSVGRLAAALGMPKSRLSAQFGSKQQLQLATVQEAARIFAEEVVQPALAAAPGLDQLTAVCEAFFAHVERRTSPGGCFMAGAALELGNRPGPLREVIDEFQARFGTLLRGFAAAAVHRNELASDENPDRLAFELNGIMLAADTYFVLHDDPAVLDLARQIVHQRLGVTGG